MNTSLTSWLLVALAFTCCEAAVAQSRVPKWDARGVGLLPQQGIACLDVAEDGSQTAVGTSASPGDPNVFVFDADGRFVRSHIVGQRAIAQVALSGSGRLHAICTMPNGRAGDGPTVFDCGDAITAVPSGLGEPGYPRTIFHYGQHSNHTGVQLSPTRAGNVTLYGSQLLWLDESGKQAAFTTGLPWSGEAVATVLVTHASGPAVAGYAVLKSSADPPEVNLFLVHPGDKEPRWKRPAMSEVGKCQAAEKGFTARPRSAMAGARSCPSTTCRSWGRRRWPSTAASHSRASPVPTIPAGNAGFVPPPRVASRTTARGSCRRRRP